MAEGGPGMTEGGLEEAEGGAKEAGGGAEEAGGGAKEVPMKAAIRCCPLTDGELLEGDQLCLQFPAGGQEVIAGDNPYQFDYVFGPSATQENVFNTCAIPLLQEIFEGYSATILAYGDTASGKTYTMGTDYRFGQENDASVGIIPRMIQWLSREMEAKTEWEFSVKVSYFELHMEKMRDLLVRPGAGESSAKPIKTPLRPIQNLSEHKVTNAQEALRLLSKGNQARAVAPTVLNPQSSRSHAFFKVTIEQRSKRDSEGHQGLLELGILIRDELRKPKPIFRGHMLRQLMEEPLGGNRQVLMIACVSSSHKKLEKTKATLKLATEIKEVKKMVTPQKTVTRRLSQEFEAVEGVQVEQMEEEEPLPGPSSRGSAGESQSSGPTGSEAAGRDPRFTQFMELMQQLRRENPAEAARWRDAINLSGSAGESTPSEAPGLEDPRFTQFMELMQQLNSESPEEFMEWLCVLHSNIDVEPLRPHMQDPVRQTFLAHISVGKQILSLGSSAAGAAGAQPPRVPEDEERGQQGQKRPRQRSEGPGGGDDGDEGPSQPSQAHVPRGRIRIREIAVRSPVVTRSRSRGESSGERDQPQPPPFKVPSYGGARPKTTGAQGGAEAPQPLPRSPPTRCKCDHKCAKKTCCCYRKPTECTDNCGCDPHICHNRLRDNCACKGACASRYCPCRLQRRPCTRQCRCKVSKCKNRGTQAPAAQGAPQGVEEEDVAGSSSSVSRPGSSSSASRPGSSSSGSTTGALEQLEIKDSEDSGPRDP